MTTIREMIRRRFAHTEPLPAGIYQYQAPPEADFPYRLHLRLEADGSGILIVNASTVLHLNQTAAEYAYHMIKEAPKEVVTQQIAARYRISKDQVHKDFTDFMDRVFTLVNMPDLDPVTFLDFERDTPYSREISAPYRLDCAITYQLPQDADPEAAPTKRVDRELSTAEWKNILDRAWQAGIPHIIFTGGEPTLRSDLPELIAHAEKLGQVTGLLSDGYKLANPEYLNELLQTGLDHLMVIFHADDDLAWKALEKVLPEDLYTTVHLTITPENAAWITDLIDKLDDFGVTSISLSNNSPDLNEALEAARQRAAECYIDLEWDLPVPYSDRNPVALELEEAERENAEGAETVVEGAGRAWLYIEPDGDVLREQGRTTVLGNAMTGDWGEIWHKADKQ